MHGIHLSEADKTLGCGLKMAAERGSVRGVTSDAVRTVFPARYRFHISCITILHPLSQGNDVMGAAAVAAAAQQLKYPPTGQTSVMLQDKIR